ncbi:MAG: hypothetical protein PF542_06935 [Nanoarchaeota archaeon]|jgi:tyrosine-specific transport protein|nr:hypothetical protein [Nanoarchaeota archaeon]
MKSSTKQYLTASSILVGTCIGAGVLGIPYIAAQSGFFVALAYILFVGFLIYTVNSFLGEVALRTKGDHQLIGYVQKYLGMKARHIMEFAVVFGIYAGLIAYMLGMGKSLSYLFFGNVSYEIHFGILAGVVMAYLLKDGIKSLKKFEKIGVLIVLGLLVVIIGLFIPKVVMSNLLGFNQANLLLPFGVVLFAFMSFNSIPEIKIVLKNNEHQFKKVLLTGTIVSIIFYSLFTLVVLGSEGGGTPEVATLGLGSVFVILGIFTMFTSYLANGNALCESFQFDERCSENKSWILASLVPIVLFVLSQLTDFFSFSRILSIGGVVSGGIVAILALLMINKAKEKGNRKAEYSMNSNWWILGFLILIFVFGVIIELI